MPAFTDKEPLRSPKTINALDAAFISLLERQNFTKIKVIDICQQAMLSRATFYAYYDDKYDFLKNWLAGKASANNYEGYAYEAFELAVNESFYKNKKIIFSLLDGADRETLDILSDFLLSLFNIGGKTKTKTAANADFYAYVNFFTGGMLRYIAWQVADKFPREISPMNIHIYDIVKYFKDHCG